jgi:hypothetical protein
MTEHFVRGTEPTETCHLHVGRSLFAKVGDWFRDAPKVEGVRPEVAVTEAPAAAADAARASNETKAEPEEPKKKRGFWSRLFGRGDKNEEKKQPKKPQP